jgi:protein arginine kinase activator
MLCESCGKNEATVSLTQITEGQVKKMSLCKECAAARNVSLNGPISLTDILFGLGTAVSEADSRPDTACPNCHMRRSDFKKTSQLGCAACYETFAEDLAPLLRAMHNNKLRHVGKIPVAELKNVKLQEMESGLKVAVAEQRFEDAARLRDMIRELKENRMPPVRRRAPVP